MGRAIVIHDVDFSSLNLGKVFTAEDVRITGLEIVAEDSYLAASFIASVLCTPEDTPMTGIKWSIVSGSKYATVNQDGEVFIAPGAHDAQIVLRAASDAFPDVYAEKTISVSYMNFLDSVSVYSDYFYTGILPSSISSTLTVEISASIDSLFAASEFLKRATLLGWNYGGQLSCELRNTDGDAFAAETTFRLGDGTNMSSKFYDLGTQYTFKKTVNLNTRKAQCYVNGSSVFSRDCSSMISHADNTELPVLGDYYPAGESADSNGITAQGGITVYGIRILVNSAQVRDYRPAYDGVNFGLYDTVNNEFITSVNGTTTGSITPGQNIVPK